MIVGVLRGLDWLIGAIAVGGLAGTAVVTCTAVVFRYGFNAALPWPEEVAGYVLVWISFAGAYLAARRGAHISFDGLVSALPAGLGSLIDRAASLVLIGFLSVISVYSVDMIYRLGADPLETVPIAQGWFMASIPICCAAIALDLVVGLVQRSGRR